MCTIFRLLLIFFYGRDKVCEKNKNLLEKKRITNNYLLSEKNNLLNLLKTEILFKK